MPVSRRTFLNSSSLLVIPGSWSPIGRQPPSPRLWRPGAVAASFPSHPPALAREMVGVAHRDLTRVKELLAQHPTLALAAWDWGFGDWEDALGAASHVGNREIAETLLAHGARPGIFSAAMLGQIDVVKAFTAASPGVESTPGPHGITLLRHALAGGPRAQPVAEYLKTLPGADARPLSKPIPAEQLAELAGQYVYGAASDERITIAVSSNTLTFAREGHSARGLTHVGDLAFFPVGAPSVRITFRPVTGGFKLSVRDGNVIVEASRILGL